MLMLNHSYSFIQDPAAALALTHQQSPGSDDGVASNAAASTTMEDEDSSDLHRVQNLVTAYQDAKTRFTNQDKWLYNELWNARLDVAKVMKELSMD